MLDYYDISIDTPLKDLSKAQMDVMLYGSKDLISYKLASRSGNVTKKTEFIEGVCTLIERRYMETSSTMSREWYATFLAEAPCPTCGGKRLNPQALSVMVGGKNIYEWTQMSIVNAITFMNELTLTKQQEEIAKLIVKEIRERLTF